MRNLHVPLPDALYKALKDESKRQGAATTTLARNAIEAWLKAQEQTRIQDEISAYALAIAGSKDDLDEDVMEAGLEQLNEVWAKEDA